MSQDFFHSSPCVPLLSLPSDQGSTSVIDAPTDDSYNQEPSPAPGMSSPQESKLLSPTGETAVSEERPRTAPGSRSTSRLGDLTISTSPLAALPKRMNPFSINHRKNATSIDSSSVPTQTIMKALASRPPPNSQLAINTIRSLRIGGVARQEEMAVSRARRFSEAISDLNLEADVEGRTNRLSALNSPCFYHKRFEEAVDLDRVLEELLEDGWLSSHSRLMQTATGVREVSRQLQRKPIKRAVRNVMIVTKARDNDLVVLTRELADWLLTTPRYGSDVGVNVYVDEKLKNSKRFNAPSLTAADPRFASMLRYWSNDMCESSPEKFDLVLTLGGDGTVLFTSWLFQRIVPPVLSFSLGSLGFLTNFEYQNFKTSLSNIMGDAGMRVNLRMRFTCTVYRHGRSGTETPVEAEQFEVLNEVVVDRGPSPYVSNLEVYGDDNLLTVVQADGIIFSTPTGSTAYSLSAGGSLVHPDIPAILLTPICPHTLSFRPMLLRDSMALRIAVPRGSRATAYAAFDGRGRVELREGDYVTIAASQYPLPTVLSRETEWIDSISRTLRWNTRGATQKAWGQGDQSGTEGEADDGRSEAEPEFDIDFENEDSRDSGYSAEGSSVGWTGTSPKRRLLF